MVYTYPFLGRTYGCYSDGARVRGRKLKHSARKILLFQIFFLRLTLVRKIQNLRKAHRSVTRIIWTLRIKAVAASCDVACQPFETSTISKPMDGTRRTTINGWLYASIAQALAGRSIVLTTRPAVRRVKWPHDIAVRKRQSFSYPSLAKILSCQNARFQRLPWGLFFYTQIRKACLSQSWISM